MVPYIPMVNALIMFPDGDPTLEQLAIKIRQGVEASGSTTFVGNLAQSPDGFDIAFGGFGTYAFGPDARLLKLAKSGKLAGKRVAIFCVHSGGGRAVADALTKQLEANGAEVVNSIAIPMRGILKHIGKGTLSEIDYVRVCAFAEKTCNRAGGVRIVHESEKQKIKGYEKPAVNFPSKPIGSGDASGR